MRDPRRNAIYLIIAVSLIAGLATGRGFMFNVAYAFIALLAFSFAWAWASTNWLSVQRQVSSRRAQVGGHVTEAFTITNTGRLPKLWLEFYDQSTLPGHGAGQVITGLMPGDAVTWQAETLCTRRGEYTLGPLKVVSGDPFGLFQLERRLEQISHVIVYPPAYEIANFVMPVGPLPGGNALRRRTHFVTTNAAGVRDYAPGDGLNRIHWLSSARKQRLLVKEFELDPLADVWLMLDSEQAVQAGSTASMATRSNGYFSIPPTTEEYAITALASIAKFFLLKDRAVGFITETKWREVLPADRGGRQLTKVLETLAVLKTEGMTPFDQLIQSEAERFSRGTTVVLVTSSMRDTWVDAAQGLASRGIQLVVVLIDAETFGGRPGARRIAERLTQFRIPIYSVGLGDDFFEALGAPIN